MTEPGPTGRPSGDPDHREQRRADGGTAPSDAPLGSGPGLRPLSRRAVLGGSGAALALWLTGCGGNGPVGTPRPADGAEPDRDRGGRAPGTGLGSDVGAHSLVAVHPLPDGLPGDRAELAAYLAELGRRARSATGDGTAPGPVTTIGLGPQVVAAIGSNLPGAAELPAFAGDEALPAHRRSGAIHLLIHGDDADALGAIHADLADHLGTEASWSERGNRPPGPVINPLGFRDEITGPTAPTDAGIFLPSGPLAGATIGVVRVLRLDHDGFGAHAPAERAAIIGRHPDGTPLSGGSPDDPVDLLARDEAGQLLIPEGAHVRAARHHYSNPGPMLRRTWHRDPADGTGAGMIFLTLQRSLATFSSTQRRLDAEDRLMDHVAVEASGTFLIPPAGEDRFASSLFRAA